MAHALSTPECLVSETVFQDLWTRARVQGMIPAQAIMEEGIRAAKAVVKTIRILECLAQEQSLGVTELARRAAFSPAARA